MPENKLDVHSEMTPEALMLSLREVIGQLSRVYQPNRDRVVTPDNVFQPSVEAGRDILEAYQHRLFKAGSRVEGLEHLEHCLGELAQGRQVLFLPEHRGNFDVPSFNALLRKENPRYHTILERLVYIAGRKLNESSDLVKMFSEKYARLVIVPRRELPGVQPGETPADTERRLAYESEASRINRAAFRLSVFITSTAALT